MIASWPTERRAAWLKKLTVRERAGLYFRWPFWARDNQLAPPGDWFCWLILAGRGFGKTRAGVEWIRTLVEGPSPLAAPPGGKQRIALIAETAADGRDVMVEGDSGFLACCPPWNRPRYEPSKRRLTWGNGCVATLYSAEEPDQLRGPQHHAAWGDEIAKWKYAADTWSNLLFGLRLGDHPRVCLTTTPRPIRTLKEIIAEPSTVTTRGTTYENRANLSPKFFQNTVAKYEGTRLGRQELDAELLEDVPGALWQRSVIDSLRVRERPDLDRVVVAVDPPASQGENSDDCGIIVAGKAGKHCYVLEDATIQRASPLQWAQRAVGAYHRWHADRLVAEVNQGGDMVEAVVRQVDPTVSYRAVRASRGKVVRAEPVAAVYERGEAHHVGSHPNLEDQMCEFTTDFDRAIMGYSPDRVDALVWALTDLVLGGSTEPQIRGL